MGQMGCNVSGKVWLLDVQIGKDVLTYSILYSMVLTHAVHFQNPPLCGKNCHCRRHRALGRSQTQRVSRPYYLLLILTAAASDPYLRRESGGYSKFDIMTPLTSPATTPRRRFVAPSVARRGRHIFPFERTSQRDIISQTFSFPPSLAPPSANQNRINNVKERNVKICSGHAVLHRTLVVFHLWKINVQVC